MKRYTTEIVANEMQMLDGRSGADSGGDSSFGQGQPMGQSAQKSAPKAQATPTNFDNFDDDIPF